MRCIICKKGHYPFQSIFQKTHVIDYSICEACFTKHPIWIESHIIPLFQHHLTILDMTYDGRYPSLAYDGITLNVLHMLGYQDHTIYILIEELSIETIEILMQIDTHNIILFNYKTL